MTKKQLIEEIESMTGVIKTLKAEAESRCFFWKSEAEQKDREILRLKNVIVEMSAKIAFGDIK